MRALSILLLGGCYELCHRSSTCDWYRWNRKRDSAWAKKVDSFMNPPPFDKE